MALRPLLLLCAAVMHAAAALADGQGKCGYVAAGAPRTFAPCDCARLPLPRGSALAQGRFEDTIDSVGFATLVVKTDDSMIFNDSALAYAAGIVEGALTSERIWQFYLNTVKGTAVSDDSRRFLRENAEWVRKQCNDRAATDEYWYQSALLLDQLQGLADGYNSNSTAGKQLPFEVFEMFNVAGDMEDIATAYPAPGPYTTNYEEHCSALVKLLADGSDIYISQVVWGEYQFMMRIMKEYDLNFCRSAGLSVVMPGWRSVFSGYPGSLSSGDDFYLLSSGLVTQETTIGNNNPDLYAQYLTPHCVLEWHRSVMANRLATGGEQWCNAFSRFKSGTYCNQWMVLDYNLFVPYQPLPENVFWVLEEVPGLIAMSDLTWLLQKQAYFPSYNAPYYTVIYNVSGWPALQEEYGDWFSYDKTARAMIFKRDHVKVQDMDGMKKLMRYNDFQNDPFSACDCDPPYSGENAISARSDLNPANGTYPFGSLEHRNHGSMDVKISSAALLRDYKLWMISGPTSDQQPVFDWSSIADFAVSHVGLPDHWDFDWQLVSLVEEN
eukprot:TRINITY_DN648_c0_g2_i1.p1 TRINITY_DN648_c0_g2~~TRINITY_DN648_c0_g2_i1.p1  ORF type:complete len:562 (+),score=135.85 TRINITY_DN648_c0_g2_i1:33-1688(+)